MKADVPLILKAMAQRAFGFVVQRSHWSFEGKIPPPRNPPVGLCPCGAHVEFEPMIDPMGSAGFAVGRCTACGMIHWFDLLPPEQARPAPA